MIEAVLNLIVKAPPPTFSEPRQWSVELRDFAAVMLQKDASQRQTAARLRSHAFIGPGFSSFSVTFNRKWENCPFFRAF